jgi:hypothetical protein
MAIDEIIVNVFTNIERKNKKGDNTVTCEDPLPEEKEITYS